MALSSISRASAASAGSSPRRRAQHPVAEHLQRSLSSLRRRASVAPLTRAPQRRRQRRRGRETPSNEIPRWKQGDMGAHCRKQSLDETRQGTATRITDTYRDLYRRLSQGWEGGTIESRTPPMHKSAADKSPEGACFLKRIASKEVPLGNHRGGAHVADLVSRA